MTSALRLVLYLLVTGYGLELAWPGNTHDAEPHGAPAV